MSIVNTKIDYTNLKASATMEDIKNLCKTASEHDFATICVNPCYVFFAKQFFPRVCTVVGYPLGANTTVTKVFETMDAIKNGATEIDMVANIGAIKSNDFLLAIQDIESVHALCKSHNVILKVIIETALLTDDEKIYISALIADRGVDFVKTSTGTMAGATIHDIELIKQAVGDKCKIKASGGIRDREFAIALINAGADRIGTSVVL
jgi:deoxyribose-phosphate aldolase